MNPGIYAISLPTKRPFRWRALWILVVLWFLASLAGIPLLRATNAPIEPAWLWGVYTAVTAVLIGTGLYLAGRTGLGAPLIEGLLDKDEIGDWARSVLAWALLAAIAGSSIVLPMSLSADPEHYPASWQLILASVKAGVTEEIWMRLLLMSFFVWLGSLVGKDGDGRPTRAVFWVAVILCALLFGGSHVESRLAIPGITVGDLVTIMIVNTLVGIVLGWLFWKLGLEGAMLAHFMIDAVASAVVMPAYLSGNLLLQVVVSIGLVLAGAWSVRILVRGSKRTRATRVS
jgi:hypothetical protein